MEIEILIAFVAIGINFILATFLPQMICNEQKQNPVILEAKKYYLLNRETIVTSSIIIGLTVYLALKLTPKIEDSVTDITGIEYSNANLCQSTTGTPDLKNLKDLFRASILRSV